LNLQKQIKIKHNLIFGLLGKLRCGHDGHARKLW